MKTGLHHIVTQLGASVVFGLLLAIATVMVWAEQKISEHGYDVHYSAFSSTFLDPQVAKKYGITRGDDIGVLNISVIEPDPDSILGTPVEAGVSGTAKNLLSQIKPLKFKKLKLERGVYYISTFAITQKEDLRFDVGVGVKGGQIKLQFRHKFDDN